jgi:hypothetical protein
MSKRETPMTHWYWKQVGGTLIEEFRAVERTSENKGRRIDAIIVPNGEHRIAKSREIDLTDQDIIVVQTKDSRLSMFLMGQAFFSAHLLKKFKPRTIHAVALCRDNDAVLCPIFESYPNMKVVTCPKDV